MFHQDSSQLAVGIAVGDERDDIVIMASVLGGSKRQGIQRVGRVRRSFGGFGVPSCDTGQQRAGVRPRTDGLPTGARNLDYGTDYLRVAPLFFWSGEWIYLQAVPVKNS